MTRHIFVGGLVILLSATGSSLGQSTQPQPIGAILTGQVLDQEGRAIVADVHVAQLRRDFRAWSYRTDLNGWFEAGGWSNTPVEVRITADGYTSERLKIDAPATWPPIVVRLKWQAIATGVVRDRLGFGVTEAIVTVSEAPTKQKLVSQISDHYVLTDDQGRFSISVPAGRSFQLKVEKDGCSNVNTAYMTLAEAQNIALDAATIECK